MADATDLKSKNERFRVVAFDRFQSTELPIEILFFTAILPISEAQADVTSK